MDDPTDSGALRDDAIVMVDDPQNDLTMTLFVIGVMVLLIVAIGVVLIANHRPPAGL
jgi:hypothetical protein